jgi:hypothetical protein
MKDFFSIYNIIYVGFIIVIFSFIDMNPSTLKGCIIAITASGINIVGYLEGRNRQKQLDSSSF